MFLLQISSIMMFIYVFLRLTVPLPMGWTLKILIGLALLAIALKHYFIYKFFGGLAAPELPRTLLMLLGWLYGALLLCALLLLARDMVFLFIWLGGKLSGASFSLPFNQVGLALAAIALLLSAWSVWQAIKVPEVISREVVIANLPQELDGLSIVQITDLHASDLLPRARVESIVEKVNAAKPDLILFTGDMVDGIPSRRMDDVQPLSRLQANYGVYGCVGNHEYYSGFNSWLRGFAKLGINILNNRHVLLEINGQKLLLAGVSDPVASQFNRPMPDPAGALNGAPDDVAMRILLAHQPRLARQGAQAGYDLQLSGHTHGGQIIGFGPISERFNEGYNLGFYQVDNMVLFVGPGAGLWNGFPMRLGVPAEITRLVLKRPGVRADNGLSHAN